MVIPHEVKIMAKTQRSLSTVSEASRVSETSLYYKEDHFKDTKKGSDINRSNSVLSTTTAASENSQTGKGKPQVHQVCARKDLVSPYHVIQAHGGYLVSDIARKCIVKYDADGQLLGDIGIGPIEAGSMTITTRGCLAVCNVSQGCVDVFDLRYSQQPVHSIGKGILGGCTGVACSSLGHYIVSDAWQHKILTFNYQGELIDEFGSKGKGKSEFRYPYYVAVDHHDNIIVSDHWNHCLKVFDPNGISLARVTSCGGPENYLRRPRGLAVDELGNIFVADLDNDRIGVVPAQGPDDPDDTTRAVWEALSLLRLNKPWCVAVSPERQDLCCISGVHGTLEIYRVVM